MRTFLDKSARLMEKPVGTVPRVLLLAAILLLLPASFLPLWRLTMFAPQYPDGLRLDIYSYKLDGGHAGQDVKEVNVLNHYIGMRDLSTEAFSEFKWIPFVVGAMGLLFLRAAVLAKMSRLVDVFVLYYYFALFALWSFGYKLYVYGHDLSPTASVKVPPFMPPLFGYRQLANFEVYSYPGPASYALAGVALVLLVTVALAARQARGAPAAA